MHQLSSSSRQGWTEALRCVKLHTNTRLSGLVAGVELSSACGCKIESPTWDLVASLLALQTSAGEMLTRASRRVPIFPPPKSTLGPKDAV